MKLYEYTIHELHDKLVKKEVSAVEITKSVLNRIDAVEDKVKAYITRTDELALAQAEAVDKKISAGENPGPLAGIAGAINDGICTKGVKTTCASKALSNFVPPYDATVMEKLSKMGMVMAGKTNLDEFAMGNSTETSVYFATANPWDLTRVPGGSSGGSAAAVAAGEAVWALGSDTCGSVRQPASFCGLVGLKPTYGLVSRYGLVSYASSLDQIGPITRDVADCALVMNAVAGYDAKDSTSVNTSVPDYTKALKQDIKDLKIGIPEEYFGESIDEEIKSAVYRAIEDMKSLGASCVKVSMPHTGYAFSSYYLIACAEASSNLARYDGVGFGWRSKALDSGDNIVSLYTKSRSEGFGEEVKRRIMLGTHALSSGYYDAYYLKAMKVRTLIKEDFERAFEKVDVLFTPTTPAPAFKIGEKTGDPLDMYLQDIYTIPANLAGVPAISVPCGLTGGNLPIGLQIIGKLFSEETILRMAYTFEQNHNYHNKIAPLPLPPGAQVEGGAL